MFFFYLSYIVYDIIRKQILPILAKLTTLPESFGMLRPMGEIPLIFRFYPEMQPIQPVKALILGSYWVISISFHLEMLAVYQVAALLLLFKRQMEKLS